jgi:hypothetical protein
VPGDGNPCMCGTRDRSRDRANGHYQRCNLVGFSSRSPSPPRSSPPRPSQPVSSAQSRRRSLRTSVTCQPRCRSATAMRSGAGRAMASTSTSSARAVRRPSASMRWPQDPLGRVQRAGLTLRLGARLLRVGPQQPAVLALRSQRQGQHRSDCIPVRRHDGSETTGDRGNGRLHYTPRLKAPLVVDTRAGKEIDGNPVLVVETA